MVGAGMRGCTNDRIAELLSEMEKLGFVESPRADALDVLYGEG
jgi:hypothetical protein